MFVSVFSYIIFIATCLSMVIRGCTGSLVGAFEDFGKITHSDLIGKTINIVLYFFVLGLRVRALRAHTDIFIQVPYHPLLIYCSIFYCFIKK